MMVTNYLIIFLLVTTFVVFVHELGHYIMAKFFNVKVLEFSIGVGSSILSFKDQSGTRWRLSWLPLGGYVKMYGDTNIASFDNNNRTEAKQKKDANKKFHYKPLWQKFIIVFAGPFANYLLSFVIFLHIFLSYGQNLPSNQITDIEKDSPASIAGILPNDIIVEVNGKSVNSLLDLRQELALAIKLEVTLIIEREGERFFTDIKPKLVSLPNGSQIPIIGVQSSNIVHYQYSFVEAMIQSLRRCYNLSKIILTAIGQMLSGQRSFDDIGGPFEIAYQSGQSLKDGGIIGLYNFIALISLNLGIMNLLPIPLLDGGHLLFYVIEILIGRPIPPTFMRYSMKAGVIMIGCLMMVGLKNDIQRYLLL